MPFFVNLKPSIKLWRASGNSLYMLLLGNANKTRRNMPSIEDLSKRKQVPCLECGRVVPLTESGLRVMSHPHGRYTDDQLRLLGRRSEFLGMPLKRCKGHFRSLPNDKIEPRRDSDVVSDALLGDTRIKISSKPMPGYSNECNRSGDAFTPNKAS